MIKDYFPTFASCSFLMAATPTGLLGMLVNDGSNPKQGEAGKWLQNLIACRRLDVEVKGDFPDLYSILCS